jgi:ArsR family transcriptional regulator
MYAPLHQFKAEFFKALAHPARIRILELLRLGELTVSELQQRLGLEPSSVSQQLAILRHRRIVEGRKVGTNVYYRVRDPQVFTILDAAREIFEAHVQELQGLLEAQREEDETVAALPRAAEQGRSLSPPQA